jgi:outer membrane receptor protein involved in Fe transport
MPTGTYQRPDGLNIPELFPDNRLNRMPGVLPLGSTFSGYHVGFSPWHNQFGSYQIRDDLSWMRGAHQLKFGGSWATFRKVQDLTGSTQGMFFFNGLYTGNDFADYLLGLAIQYSELASQNTRQWNNFSWAAYVQDNWRVNRRLTLNLGLRWDGVPHTYEANNRVANFYPRLYDPSQAALLEPDGTISAGSPGLGTSPNPALSGLEFYLNGIGIAGRNGISSGLVENHWAALGPRIGFAYDPAGTGKTVLRGGFGAMYERIQGNDMYYAGPNQPFSATVTFNAVPLSNPGTSLITGQKLAAPILVGNVVGLAEDTYKLPVSYQYSLGIQRLMWRDGLLSLAYVGSQNRHQNRVREINLPDPSVLP